MRRCRRPGALALAALHLLTGCFQYVPAATGATPPAGTGVALEVNDQGRVALAPVLGPGVIRIEGRLMGVEGEEFVLSASSVMQIGTRAMGLEAVTVRVPTSHVVRIEQRALSRKRTALVIGGIAAGIVTFFVSKGWFGRSTPPDDGGGPGGPDQSRH